MKLLLFSIFAFTFFFFSENLAFCQQDRIFLVGSLIKDTQDKNPKIRLNAITSLGSYLDYSQQIVPVLIRLMKFDVDKQVKYRALESLGYFGKGAKSAIPDIFEVRDKNKSFIDVFSNNPKTPYDYQVIQFVLRKIGPDCVPYLIKVLKNEKCNEREYFEIIETLQSYGLDAHESVPVLIETADLYSPGDCEIIGTAISKISNHEIPYLSDVLNNSSKPDVNKRCVAAIAIGYSGDPVGVNSLVKILANKNEDQALRYTTLSSLIQLLGINRAGELLKAIAPDLLTRFRELTEKKI